MEHITLGRVLAYGVARKEAAIGFSSLSTPAKAGIALSTRILFPLLFGIPVALGATAGMAVSKIQEPVKEDIDVFEKNAYLDNLRQRLNRLKRLPDAEYKDVEQERTIMM